MSNAGPSVVKIKRGRRQRNEKSNSFVNMLNDQNKVIKSHSRNSKAMPRQHSLSFQGLPRPASTLDKHSDDLNDKTPSISEIYEKKSSKNSILKGSQTMKKEWKETK